MAALGEAEEILLYYSGESALDPPKREPSSLSNTHTVWPLRCQVARPYKMSRIMYQDATWHFQVSRLEAQSCDL